MSYPDPPPPEWNGYSSSPYGGTPYGGTPYGGTPYGGTPYGASPYGGGSLPMGTNPLAIGSLVIGISSLVFGLVCCVGVVTGPLAAVLGTVAVVQVGATGQAGRGLAIAGIVTGLLSLVVYAGLVIAVLAH